MPWGRAKDKPAKDEHGINFVNGPIQPVASQSQLINPPALPPQPRPVEPHFIATPKGLSVVFDTRRPVAYRGPGPVHSCHNSFLERVNHLSSTRPRHLHPSEPQSSIDSGLQDGLPSQQGDSTDGFVRPLSDNVASIDPSLLGRPCQPPAVGKFVYQSLLHSDSIRLMRIEPGTREEITICLETARLGQISHSYDALSYVWGEITQKVQVRTLDGAIKVRYNLCDALYRLRLPDKPRYVWVDAVCINQDDVHERGQQVRLMRGIFKSATSVMIWLGNDEREEAPVAFSIARRIACGGECNGRHAAIGSADGTSEMHCATTVQIPADSPLWQPVANLFKTPWFSRVWCIQEVALASSATVLWGRSEISWKWLGLAAARMHVNRMPICSKHDVRGLFNAYFMYRISQGDVTVKPHLLPFLHLLAMTRQFGATDPRDRIYGLLGLATTDSELDNGLLYVQPDYSLSLEDVYRQLAYRVIGTDKSLRLLSCVQHGPEICESWPSWIPRWEKVYSSSLTPFNVDDTTSPSTIPTEHRLVGKDILQVNGVHVSTIQEVLLPFPRNDKKFLPSLDEDQREKLNKFLEQSGGLMQFSLTLTAGLSWHGDFVTDHDGHLKDFANFIKDNEPEIYPHFKDVPWGSGSRISKAAYNACAGRRLFFDAEGQLGLAPEAAEPGDWVCLLSGGDVPFVVRPKGDFFLLVGECYLYKYMEGRAAMHLLEFESQRRAFEFC
ncbi:heterokaryon incompatibility protein-domain-containing protein [Thelonectria olida]|uniref:Heterokaryon incompatibility protein-domain-containing protein n=1 Tax=Thelonectria olida TaxID=1576542 RepID=A0A9P8W0U0_9HYPO|nr:heterokaryon incompatibility protein-domain-containing protein [Thelonectria olida]